MAKVHGLPLLPADLPGDDDLIGGDVDRIREKASASIADLYKKVASALV